MLSRLRVRGFKTLVDVDVELSPFSVLIGPNAVGKSNVLEAITLLARIVTGRTLADAFDQPLRGHPAEFFALPTGGLEDLLSRARVDLEIEADIVIADPRIHGLRYRIGVSLQPQSGELTVRDEFLGRLRKDGRLARNVTPRIERAGDELVIRRLEAGAPRKEPVGLNHAIASNLQYAGEGYDEMMLLRRELRAWRMHYLDPAVAMRAPQPPREVDHIGFRGEWIAPFLYRLKQDAQTRSRFSAVVRALRRVIPSVEDFDVHLDRKRGTIDFSVIQDGTPFSSRIVSEGTLRVLALCALAASPWPASLLAFEEPENGVHPTRIELVTQLLRGMTGSTARQVIVTTHSPVVGGALIDEISEDGHQTTLLACRSSGRATELQPIEDLGPLFRKDTIESALTEPSSRQMFSELYQRGWLDG